MQQLNRYRWTTIMITAMAVSLTACGGGDGGTTVPGGDGGGGGGTLLDGAGPGVAPGTANVALRSLSYTDTANWRYRVELQTAADATADSEGNLARYEEYSSNTAGTRQTWSFGPDSSGKDDLFFNGSNWRQCAAGYRTTVSGLNSLGERNVNYCDQYKTGSETIVPTDVSGLTIASVMQTIRGEPGGDGFVNYADYGPADPGALGGAVFPAGSYRQDVVTTVDLFRPRYAQQDANKLRYWTAEIAAGGDSRSSPGVACANIPNNATPDSVSPLASTLEQVIDAARGTPCIFSGSTATNRPGLPDSWWEATTQEFGVLTGVDVRPAGSGDHYLPEPSMRVAFTQGSEVTYYECLVRNVTPRNARSCLEVGKGSYVVENAGDARVLMFSGVPAAFDGLGRDRVFVERGGAVYAGTMERPGVSDQVGFNDVASRAVLGALRIPVPVPR